MLDSVRSFLWSSFEWSEEKPLSDEEAVELFISASLHGNVEHVKSNLSFLNAQNKQKDSALGSAAINNQVDVIKLFISLESALQIDILDEDNCTPLMLALSQGHDAVGRLLIEAGASVTKKDINSWTVVHHAAAGGCLNVLRKLKELKVDLQTLSRLGENALFMAAYGGHLETVQFLLSSAVDPRVNDDDGKRSMDVAEDEQIVELLQNYVEQLDQQLLEQADHVVIETQETDALLET